MRVDPETKTAFIVNRRGEIKIYDFNDVSSCSTTQTNFFRKIWKSNK